MLLHPRFCSPRGLWHSFLGRLDPRKPMGPNPSGYLWKNAWNLWIQTVPKCELAVELCLTSAGQLWGSEDG